MSGSIIQAKCETIKRELKGLLRRYCQTELLRPGFAVKRCAQAWSRRLPVKTIIYRDEYYSFSVLRLLFVFSVICSEAKNRNSLAIANACSACLSSKNSSLG